MASSWAIGCSSIMDVAPLCFLTVELHCELYLLARTASFKSGARCGAAGHAAASAGWPAAAGSSAIGAGGAIAAPPVGSSPGGGGNGRRRVPSSCSGSGWCSTGV
eukprot:9501483-Pyramimonas_sp.AAC.1